MNNKLIRLTESDLHRIVKESVNKILKEFKGDENMYGDPFEKVKEMYSDGNDYIDFDRLIPDIFNHKLDEFVNNNEFCRKMSVFIMQHRDIKNLKRFNTALRRMNLSAAPGHNWNH